MGGFAVAFYWCFDVVTELGVDGGRGASATYSICLCFWLRRQREDPRVRSAAASAVYKRQTLYLVGYPWLELILQLRDTMSLRMADLGSVCVRARSGWVHSHTQKEPPLISSTRATAWSAKRDPEAKMLSLLSFPRHVF